MRQLRWWKFLLLVLVYVAIIQIGGLTLGKGISSDETFETAGNMLKAALIPIACSSLFAIGLATWLRWWPKIIHEGRRVQKWLWFIPITFLVTALLITDWGNLVDQQVGLVLLLLLMTCLVGFTEELMFRGIGVLTFRREGLTEAKVALYSSIVFGAVHLSNAIGTGASALVQATVVAFSGYFFYLTRRVSGAIWLPMIVHASWDFSLISAQIGIDTSPYAPALLAVVVQIVIGIVLIKRRRKIEPTPAST